MRPALISCASQATLTLLSRPEKPPMPATRASLATIAEDALDWLATASVPPPCTRMYASAALSEPASPNGDPPAARDPSRPGANADPLPGAPKPGRATAPGGAGAAPPEP